MQVIALRRGTAYRTGFNTDISRLSCCPHLLDDLTVLCAAEVLNCFVIQIKLQIQVSEQ